MTLPFNPDEVRRELYKRFRTEEEGDEEARERQQRLLRPLPFGVPLPGSLEDGVKYAGRGTGVFCRDIVFSRLYCT